MENSKTLAESGIHIGDLPGGVITMHVVVQPPVAKKKTGLFSFSLFFPSIKDWHIIYEVILGSLPEELYFQVSFLYVVIEHVLIESQILIKLSWISL